VFRINTSSVVDNTDSARQNWRTSLGKTFNQVLAWIGLGREPRRDWPFDDAKIARYSEAKAANVEHASPPLDLQTWRDLELTRYRLSLTARTSIFGQQFLHHQLRCGATPAQREQVVQRLRELLNTPELRARLIDAFLPLRQADTEIADFLFARPAERFPTWLRYALLLPLMFLCGAAVLMVSLLFIPLSSSILALSAATSLIAFVLMLAVQRQFNHRVAQHQLDIQSLRLMLATAVSLHKAAPDSTRSSSAQLTNAAIADEARSIHRRITPLPWLNLFPGMNDYADWFLLDNIRRFRKCSRVVEEHRDFLQQCFEVVAQTEAELAMAEHLAKTSIFCWAKAAPMRELRFGGAVHPLLANATPLTMSFTERGALLTGQNGVGKSTLLKTVGVNLVSSNAFGFCYAQSAEIPDATCITSLSNEDSLENGESLYISELRRAAELLSITNQNEDCICLIDEIFRGTNHIDAVASAAAVLHALSQRALIVVSSHHLVLAPLLTRSLSPYYLRMESTPAATRTLVPGVLPESNGIALLAEHGFAPEVQDDAIQIRDWMRTGLLPKVPPPSL
jgi:hypothetical protein